MTDFRMPDSWYDPPEVEEFDPSCPDCGEDALTVDGYLVSCMECEYSNDLSYDDYDDEPYYDDEENWDEDADES